jgi:hypothetical protein
VSSQEEHRVVDNPSGVFAAARLPLGSSLTTSKGHSKSQDYFTIRTAGD